MKSAILEALAEQLAENKRLVKFKDHSPLASIPARDMHVEFGTDGSSFIDLAAEDKEKEIAALAKQLAGKLVGEISFYKETVRPYIEDTYDAVMRNVNEAMKAPVIDLDVVFVEIPGWLGSTSVKERIKTQAGLEPGKLSTFVKIPTMEANDMVNLAMTTDGNLSQQIAEWMSNISQETLKGIWEKWFVDGAVYNSTTTDNVSDINELTVVWAWANALSMEESIPEGINATLTQYKTFIGGALKNIAFRVKTALEYIERARRIESITLGVRPEDKRVFIDRATFDRWTNDGGNMDLIFGWWVTPGRGRVLTVPAARERADEFRTNFNKQAELAGKSRQLKVSAMIADSLEAHFRVFRANPHESVLRIAKENPAAWEGLKKQFATFINNVRSRDYHDANISDHVTNLVIKTVCSFFFPHTNASSFFFKLKDVMGRNAELSGDEAAKFAAVYLIVDYIASQTTLQPVVVQQN